jgi:DNA-binding LytR/AlgR family response regulator
MILNTLIIDDDKTYMDYLKSLLGDFPEINLVAETCNERDFFDVINKNKIDLVFLDIEIGETSGFDIAKLLTSSYPGIMIIFITGYSDFAIDGYEYEPVDFISKPIQYIKLQRAVRKAAQRKARTSEYSSAKLKVQNGGQLELISIPDIIYVEKIGKKVCINCLNEQKIVYPETIKAIYDELKDYNFYRCHQSFLVSLDKIKSIKVDNLLSAHAYYIELIGTKEKIPLSRNFYNELKDILIKY